jgi:hypothetical protein
LATNVALRQSTSQFGPTLIPYTYLQPTIFFAGGRGTNSYVPQVQEPIFSQLRLVAVLDDQNFTHSLELKQMIMKTEMKNKETKMIA